MPLDNHSFASSTAAEFSGSTSVFDLSSGINHYYNVIKMTLLFGPFPANGATHNYLLIKEMWQQVVLSEGFRPAASGAMGPRDKEKYMSPIWILEPLH